jgi:adenine-specific DNA-methyltransferase
LRGGFFESSAIFMQHYPVPVGSDARQAPITDRVRQILTDPGSPDVPRLEAEINRLVYALYGLTPQEVQLVEKTEGNR